MVFGKASGWPASAQPLNSTFLNGTNGVEFDAAAAGYWAGTTVAAGDINGDGKADIIIGASEYAVNGAAGAVYVVFGKSPLLPTTTVSTTNASKGNYTSFIRGPYGRPNIVFSQYYGRHDNPRLQRRGNHSSARSARRDQPFGQCHRHSIRHRPGGV